jgi:hypothetical protein
MSYSGFWLRKPTPSSRPSAQKPCSDLATTEQFDLWLEGETVEALKLQRPLPDGMLDIVARGEKEDPPAEAIAVERWRGIDAAA